MVTVNIDPDACRGCQLCEEECPVKVFVFDTEKMKALVKTPEDCIGCLSCRYICPSAAIVLQEYHEVKNFYRDLEFSRQARRFL
jgi:NAD-dependent dihydropyrimidine dehydrogenase PreA subunit